MNHPTLILRFDAGTLLLDGADDTLSVPAAFQWMSACGVGVRLLLLTVKSSPNSLRQQIPHEDQARNYHDFEFQPKLFTEPRPYQQASIDEWKRTGRRGVIVLPTGAGKSFVAQMAIELTKRSTLIIVPTLDLMQQWYDLMLSSFNVEVGLIGGGYFEVGAITITTYSSAFRFMERLGNQFGLLICDECHHLPGNVHRYAADLAIAPFRLGLTATPERADGGEELLNELLGPIIYRLEAQELAGLYLADYSIVRVRVTMNAEERAAYDRERNVYRDFVRSQNIRLSSVQGWQMFVMASARSQAGRAAMLAYRESKRIALGTEAKLKVLTELLRRHARERVLIFTAENEMVYRISEQFLIPAITHETPIKERKQWLDAFNRGEILALATSKVLNEGVNIPEAAVAIILSGSGSTREHIQRLGRILRKQPDKEAVLYEVVTSETTEEHISQRRSDTRQFHSVHESLEPKLRGWGEDNADG
ncbi:MAG: DEAD/DEAH box helicase [Blastocatellia bacterium]